AFIGRPASGADRRDDCQLCFSPRGRRSGVILPGQETDSILLENVKAAPRRSSIIKPCSCCFSGPELVPSGAV
uniref:Uncharacterized protein n=1 Tax=Nothobranchius furzeri TaxID=105023 RepID=A0A8C6KRC4_NOTFU